MEVTLNQLSNAKRHELADKIDYIMSAARQENAFASGSTEGRYLQDLLRIQPANYRGARDGILGSGSRLAIRRLNKAMTGEDSGTLTRATLIALQSDLRTGATTAPERAAPSAPIGQLTAPSTGTTPALQDSLRHLASRPGEEQFTNGSNTMKALQRMLKSDFGYTKSIDGIYGPNMRDALTRFNASRGHASLSAAISPSMVAEYAREKLGNSNSRRQETPAANPSRPARNNEERPALNSSLKSSVEYIGAAATHSNAFGTRSREMFEFQKVLKAEYGYDAGIDGIRGPRMKAALRRFNKDVAGIDSDRILGNVISRYAQNRLGERPRAAAAPSVLASSGTAPGQVSGADIIDGIIQGSDFLEAHVNSGASPVALQVVDRLLVAAGRLDPSEMGNRGARSEAIIALKYAHRPQLSNMLGTSYSASEDWAGAKFETNDVENPTMPAEEVFGDTIAQHRETIEASGPNGRELYKGLRAGYTGVITQGAMELLVQEVQLANLDPAAVANGSAPVRRA